MDRRDRILPPALPLNCLQNPLSDGGTVCLETAPVEDMLHSLAQSLEESSRVLRNMAVLYQTSVEGPAVDRIEAEGIKAKLRAEAIRRRLA